MPGRELQTLLRRQRVQFFKVTIPQTSRSYNQILLIYYIMNTVIRIRYFQMLRWIGDSLHCATPIGEENTFLSIWGRQ